MKKCEKERKAQVLEMLSKQKIRSVSDIEAYKLSVCHPFSAGIDLGSRSNYVAINPDKEKGLKEPEYHQEEDFRVVIWRKNLEQVPSNVPSNVPSSVPSRDQVSTKLNLRWNELEPLITAMVEPRSAAELREVAGLQNHTRFKRAFINPLIELGIVVMTQPDSPNSPTQRYVLTEAGKELLKV